MQAREKEARDQGLRSEWRAILNDSKGIGKDDAMSKRAVVILGIILGIGVLFGLAAYWAASEIPLIAHWVRGGGPPPRETNIPLQSSPYGDLSGIPSPQPPTTEILAWSPTPITSPSPTEVATATPTPTPTLLPLQPTATPTIPPLVGEWIAFETERHGSLEIYVMRPDGSNQMDISNNWADDGAPAWSPDGKRIAFASWRDTALGTWHGPGSIYIMNNNGTNQVRLTDGAGGDNWPTWSPDGARIAFQSGRSGNLDIWVINVDGTGLINLTNNPAPDAYPDWSPDGTRIAFASQRDGNWEIYLMDADGSNPINNSQNPAMDIYPMWSPDGTRLTFHSRRDGNREIYVMNADGSGQVNLTNHPDQDWLATWSPDGGRLAFYSDRSGDKESYVMNADGSGAVNISQSPASSDEFPSWSPFISF